MIDTERLQVDDRVQFLSPDATLWRASVQQTTEHYVALSWTKKQTVRFDIVLKTSPLWQLLELVK